MSLMFKKLLTSFLFSEFSVLKCLNSMMGFNRQDLRHRGTSKLDQVFLTFRGREDFLAVVY